MLNAYYTLSHRLRALNLTLVPLNKYNFYLHFTDEVNEA